MDVSLSLDKVGEITHIAESVKGVRGVHAVRFRKSGPVIFGEMHLELQEGLPIEKAHEISEEVEEKIKKQFKDIESITIHMGVSHKDKIKIGIPIIEDRGLESKVSPHFGNAPLFAFVEVEKGQVMNIYSKVNRAAKLMRKKGISAAQFLVEEKVDAVIVGSLGEGPFYVLKDNLVQIYSMPQFIKVKEAIALLNKNKLEKILSPVDASQRKEEE